MYKDNKDLYPTPKELANKMLSKVNWRDVKNILEPSAGLGHLVEAIKDYTHRHTNYNISCIEIDNKCRNVLIGNNYNVIDSDFLAYNGLEQFDLIVANFPFSDGDLHLHKAIDVLFSGQIVCLINAETIKNPFSNSRKSLIQKLNKLNASIEYIQNAFLDAERKTGVEVALIYINKVQDVETELFNDIQQSEDNFEDIKEENAIATKDNIHNIVQRYNQDKETVTNQIMDFYKNYKKVSKYLTLGVVGQELDRHQKELKCEAGELTKIMKQRLNDFAIKLKKDYWIEAMQLDEIKSKLTSKKRKELASELNSYCNMDFTENNIKIFIQNLVAKYPTMIDEAINEMFDKFTEYAFRDGRNQNNEYSQNIHLFNGWKTNTAYKVNKKVILPFRADGWEMKTLYSDKRDFFDDIDLVFNYFDSENKQNEVLEYQDKSAYNNKGTIQTDKTSEIVAYQLEKGEAKNIKTRYFNVTLYKKGTVHLIFNDLDMLRRFNLFVAKKRGWLPSDYSYSEKRNKDVDFETDKEYQQIKGTELAINTKNVLMIGV